MGFFLSFIFYTSESLGQQKKKMWIHLLRYFFLLYLFYHIEIQNGSAFTWWISGVFQSFFRWFLVFFLFFFCSFLLTKSYFIRICTFCRKLSFLVLYEIFNFISYNTILTRWWSTFQLSFSVLFPYLLRTFLNYFTIISNLAFCWLRVHSYFSHLFVY